MLDDSLSDLLHKRVRFLRWRHTHLRRRPTGWWPHLRWWSTRGWRLHRLLLGGTAPQQGSTEEDDRSERQARMQGIKHGTSFPSHVLLLLTSRANVHATTNRASANHWQRSSCRRRARRCVPSAPATAPRTRQQAHSAQTPRQLIQEPRRPQTLTGPYPCRLSSRVPDQAAQPKRSSPTRAVWRWH